MDGLDDFLEGENSEPQPEATEAPEEIVEQQPETAEEAERPRDDKGRFAPKGEKEVPPPGTEDRIPVAALQEERRKRQELEAELQRLTQQQPQQPPPSIWEDEQGWQQHFGGQVVNEAVTAATFNARLDMSEMMVRQSQPDFEEKKAAFIELMREVPGLQQKALADPHPWNFAYNYVTNHQRMNELSATNVAELEAKLRAQIEAEYAAKQQPKAPSPEIPETLADAQSSRGSESSAFAPTALDDILGMARRANP